MNYSDTTPGKRYPLQEAPIPPRVGLKEVAIEDIWLMREGGENGIASVVVYVKREGVWYEAIRELAEGSFSHCISASGLVSDSCKPVKWLNSKPPAQER